MGIGSNSICALVGHELVGIDVEDGIVYFIVLDKLLEAEVEYAIRATGNYIQDTVVDIDGDMADLIDTPITRAYYDANLYVYTIESALGIVRFSANGPDTTFERA